MVRASVRAIIYSQTHKLYSNYRLSSVTGVKISNMYMYVTSEFRQKRSFDANCGASFRGAIKH